MKYITVLIVLFSLSACDLNGSKGASDSDLQSLETTLLAKIDAQNAIINQLNADVIAAKSAANTVRLTQTSTKANTKVNQPTLVDFSFVSYLPADQPISSAKSVSLKSPMGYLLSLGAPDGGLVLPPDLMYFENADCTGRAFIDAAAISEYGLSQGVVMSAVDAAGVRVGYVPSNSEFSDNQVLSYYINGQQTCTNYPSAFTLHSVLLSDNDEAITGVSNDPYTGPIVIQ